MFGRKKQLKAQEQILSDISDILQNSAIKPEEREALVRVATRLQKNEYTQRVLSDFLAQVRNLALQSKLSPSVAKFYSSIINNTYEGTGWSGMMFM